MNIVLQRSGFANFPPLIGSRIRNFVFSTGIFSFCSDCSQITRGGFTICGDDLKGFQCSVDLQQQHYAMHFVQIRKFHPVFQNFFTSSSANIEFGRQEISKASKLDFPLIFKLPCFVVS